MVLLFVLCLLTFVNLVAALGAFWYFFHVCLVVFSPCAQVKRMFGLAQSSVISILKAFPVDTFICVTLS
jgi:hypothetical protein